MPSVRPATQASPPAHESPPRFVLRAIDFLDRPVPGARASGNPGHSDPGSFQGFISELRTSVLIGGSEDAVDVLFNLALGKGAKSQAATQALLEIAGDSCSSDQVRALIAQWSLQATENYFRPEGSSPDKSFPVPAPLLWLALRDARGSQGMNERIGDEISRALRDAGLTPQEMSQPNRYCGPEEMLLSLGPLESGSLSIHRQVIATSQVNFKESIQELKAQAIHKNKPQAVILNHGNHWVVVVVAYAGALQRVDVAVYDSLHLSVHKAARGLHQGIRAALDAELGAYTHAGDNIQGNTNGCGPLCVRALRGLRDWLERGSGGRPSDAVAEFLRSEIREVGSWPKERLESVVAGVRAQMLYGLQHPQDRLWLED